MKQVFSDYNDPQNKKIILSDKIKYVNFQNFSVTFGKYQLIDNSCFKINSENVFIRGNSGVGKSTIGKILSRLIDNYEGLIEINGVDIRNIDETYLRRKIIYVPNEIELFSSTLKENICLDKTIMDDTLKEICYDFRLQEIINRLPGGINYKISLKDSKFSTGEKQRIALARAVILEPDIIIFDESLSNIDNSNKKEIINNLQKYSFIKIFITHEDDYIKNGQTIIIENHCIREDK